MTLLDVAVDVRNVRDGRPPLIFLSVLVLQFLVAKFLENFRVVREAEPVGIKMSVEIGQMTFSLLNLESLRKSFISRQSNKKITDDRNCFMLH